jgi:AcrR family transcriptional regulator
MTTGTAHPEPPRAEPPEGRRERQKAETRRRLLDAARALFVERGFDATRPQDVARAADVASGTFYVHFADRREAFLAFTDEAAAELMERVRERVSGASSCEQRLRGSREALLEYSDAHPGVVRAAFADEGVISSGLDAGTTLRDRLAQSLAQALREGMLERELCPDYDPLVVAYGIVGFIQQAFVHASTELPDRAELIDNVTRFCGRALVAPRESDR